MSRPLFVANAGNQLGRAIASPAISERLMFDKPEALSRRGGVAAAGRSVFGLLNFFKNMGQGACAGLLTLLGAAQLTGVAPTGSADIAPLAAGAAIPTTLEELAAAFLSSGAPGVLEIIGAIALFLNAGRGAGRILGLLAFVLLAVGHANGVSHTEFLETLAQVSDVARTALTGVVGFF